MPGAQNWIRSAAWDGFCVLSGLPIGLLLLLLSAPQLYAFACLAVLLETGHALSPIALAWMHTGFRRIMLEHKAKYILLPASIFTAAILIGGITSLGLTEYHRGTLLFVQMSSMPNWKNPFPILMWVYMIWNAYHFGMQNFGVLTIYRIKNGIGARSSDRIFCLTMTCTAMALSFPVWFVHWHGIQWPCIALSLTATTYMIVREIRMGLCLPRLIFILADGLGLALMWWQPLIGLAIYSLNHWLVAIGLSSHVYSSRRYWAFALLMLAAGAIGFLWLIPSSNGNLLRMIPILVGARLGLGLTHFLYDRWLWKFGDPHVRATIGTDLFRTLQPSGIM